MDIQLFALESSRQWGEALVSHSKHIRLAKLEERAFEDGEHKIRPLESVRGQCVCVTHSLFSDEHETVNDKICKLLFLIGTLKDAAAQKITVLIPYFAYARKDSRTKLRDPITMKYMAQLLEIAGADHIVTMDIHNQAAFENAFRIPTDHLEARFLFASYFKEHLHDQKPVTVISPDIGGIKRAEAFRETLEKTLGQNVFKGFLEKKRSAGIVSGGTQIIGDVEECTAVIVDDLISTGTTLTMAADALHKQGAKRIFAMTTHGLFVGDANKKLSKSYIDKCIITNTVKPFRLDKKIINEKIIIVDAAKVFAKVVDNNIS